MTKLSIAIAVFNEEKNIGECLASVSDLADEIVVVDGGSTDKTVEIGKSFGAKTIITTNPPIFHLNKQKAIEAASGDWILQLDADERVTEELKKEILSSIIHNPPSINGYWIPRKNWFLGKFLMKGGQYPDYTLRLYRRGRVHLPCKSVHEQVKVDGETGYLKKDLIHIADPDFRRYLKRWHRYTDLLASEIKEETKDQRQLVPIGNICLGINFLMVKPIWWFLLTYIRHKGFLDSWQGFVFSFFSSLRFPAGYIKYLKK